MFMCASAGMCAEVNRQPRVLVFASCMRCGLLIVHRFVLRPVGPLASRESPVSTFHLAIGTLRMQTHATTLNFV